MAALPTPLSFIDLRDLGPEQMRSLLDEEVEEWRTAFDWDFRPSADLVARYVGSQTLAGYAVLNGSEAVAYVYYVVEERKGLVGDLYVRKTWRWTSYLHGLLNQAVRTLSATRGIQRIEAQLMLVSPEEPFTLPIPNLGRSHAREFMLLDTGAASRLSPAPTPELVYDTWQPRWQEEAAQLIPRCYASHVDSDINDQYRSVDGARRFLHNIVQYPGCGMFYQPASFAAISEGGQLLGLCLASLVAFDVGHITQICVAPEARGTKVGYELLRRSIHMLSISGCRRVSLTVTGSNTPAVRLYRAMGFETVRRFRAAVWDL
jgi:ribosomal protein S18 acetylase RimI-like enzyme